MTGYLALICGALLGGIIAYFRGHKAGATAAKSETQAKQLEAIKTAKGVDNAINNLDEPHINAALDRFMRDKQR